MTEQVAPVAANTKAGPNFVSVGWRGSHNYLFEDLAEKGLALHQVGFIQANRWGPGRNEVTFRMKDGTTIPGAISGCPAARELNGNTIADCLPRYLRAHQAQV